MKDIPCPTCGNLLDGPLLAEGIRAAVITKQPAVHICGVCKTFLYLEGGKLRQLTPAEMLHIEMTIPGAAEFVRKLSRDTAGIVLAKERKMP